MWEKGELANLCGNEQHGRAVLTSGGASTATNARSVVHCLIGGLLRDRNCVSIWHTTCIHRYKTTCLDNLIVGTTVNHKVLDYRECVRTPWLHCDCLTVFEAAHVERPIVKARYLLIPADSKSIKNLRKLMASEDEAEVMEAANLASTTAIKYVDQADTWMDALSLAREMGIEYQKLLSGIHNQFMEYTDENGILHLAYLAEQVPEGKTAPLEYCEDRIRELILSARKHALEESLEQDVLEDARKNNKYVIY